MNDPIRCLLVSVGLAVLAACAQPHQNVAAGPTDTNASSVAASPPAESGKDKASGPAYGKFSPSSFSNSVVLVPWLSAEGQKRFDSARHKQDFYQLAQTYQPQANPLYCGIASSVIVLNALRLPSGTAPHQPRLEIAVPGKEGRRMEFVGYTQDSLLNEDTDKVKPRTVIELKDTGQDGTPNPGLSLADLKGVLEAHQARADIRYADDDDAKAGAAKLRETAKQVLADSSSFLVANFKGVTLGAMSNGHLSPLGAYDAKSDSLLVMDVASHKNPWYWVPVGQLYRAMHTLDGSHYRGYLVVSDGPSGLPR